MGMLCFSIITVPQIPFLTEVKIPQIQYNSVIYKKAERYYE